jgi:hypothetical protein
VGYELQLKQLPAEVAAIEKKIGTRPGGGDTPDPFV